MPEFNNLNKTLTDNGYAAIEQLNFATGGGFSTSDKKLITQFDFYTYDQSKKNLQNATTFIKGYGVGSMLGYYILSKEKFKVYPFAGITYTWTSVKLTQEIPTKTQFNNYINSPANQLEITNNNFTSNIGVQFNFTPKVKKDDTDRFIIGLKTGYYMPLLKSMWFMNDTELENSPKINPGGFYASIVLGITK